MVDAHDNRVTVTLGDCEIELAATKLAERIYGDRFRDDVEALGKSNSTRMVKVPTGEVDAEGNPVTESEVIELSYVGRLKIDIAVSANSNVGVTAEIPDQVVAAAWAMAKASGSTDKTYDDFFAWWLTLPSSAQQDMALWEAVCVDLAERAFFRDYGRPGGAEPSDEIEEA